MNRALAAVSLAAALQACSIPEDGPMMEPGEDCIRCHGDGGGEEEDGPAWSVAGTVYPSESTADPGAGVRGASIWIQDSNGKTFTLRSNKAGNFYSAESLAFPIRVVVSNELRHGLPSEVSADRVLSHGSCNRCHHLGAGGEGRVHE
jgi:hypothetical protein